MQSIEAGIDHLIDSVGKNIVMALPLGLGKANHFANGIFKRAQSDPAITLHIVTALTLEFPRAKDELSSRFLQPFVHRIYADYPELEYAISRRDNSLPTNVKVSEFFLNPGQLLGNTSAQCEFLNSNYTHAVRDLVDLGVNVIAHQVAPNPDGRRYYSLSCNPDVTIDLVKALKAVDKKVFTIAQVNRKLPYLHGEAEISETFFDLLITGDNSQQNDHGNFPLFAIPQAPVGLSDYAIAAHASTLIKDGGTIQIGIGSMGDAIAFMLAMRQHDNQNYQRLLNILIHSGHADIRPRLELEKNTFEQGIYANTEMYVEGLLYLRKHSVLTRKVYPSDELQSLLDHDVIQPEISPELINILFQKRVIKAPLSVDDFQLLKALHCIPEGLYWQDGDIVSHTNTVLPESDQNPQTVAALCDENIGQPLGSGHYCHAGFFIGSENFYQQLRDLDNDSRDGLNMCPVSYTNHLYGNEALKRVQRRDSRFINTGMMATLTGAIISDGLKDYKIVSGVGGQYNFVAQAHELPNSRSIICLHSTRTAKGKTQSNIVWDYPHVTIPRHLRDIVITEYGMADLRGVSDREVISRMLCIADSRFQPELLKMAKAAGKIEIDYEVPEAFCNNFPEAVHHSLRKESLSSHLPHYPMGSDFTREEMTLAIALKLLKQINPNRKGLVKLLAKGWKNRNDALVFDDELKRMGLDKALTAKQYFYRLLLIGALISSDLSGRPLLKSF
ncbi:acetyl-CoA hydrolase/transferase C-terminal domain-containing protein [Pseudomaricurvus hydrocarbonicus]|uniref:acetyl-CoA hydrolase/transferase C-terminal domain-containing protein n=1 Tax=Pseudomaricurvus hydrocarbonicus TaxID=1470433 RepID=UPI001420A511|nr:acetyl-CoA hydrolase/transferase C-terminal domain-containing protein [Aestuariicella hydrocarbonica]